MFNLEILYHFGYQDDPDWDLCLQPCEPWAIIEELQLRMQNIRNEIRQNLAMPNANRITNDDSLRQHQRRKRPPSHNHHEEEKIEMI